MNRVLLADIRCHQRAINKDMMGGYGTGSQFSKNKFALVGRLLEYYKYKSIFLPNLTLAYIAAFMRQQNWAVDFTTEINATNDSYDVVVIYGSAPEFSNEKEFARRMKQQNPRTRVGFTGTLPSQLPDLYNDVADFIFVGEPEGFLQENPDWDFSGPIRCSRASCLDSLPEPYWEPFLRRTKFFHKPLLGRKGMLSLYSTRGCPMSCQYYCPYPTQQGNVLRKRNPELICDEIERNHKDYNVQALLFRDPIFGMDKKHLREFLHLKMQRGLEARWAAEMHLNTLNEEIIRLMKLSGCAAITVGIEAYDKEVLKKSKRVNAKREKLEKNLKLLSEYGIKVMAGFIVGSLDDTPQTMENTFAYAKQLNTSYAQFTVSTPYPGTEYYEELKDRLITDKMEAFGAYSLVFQHDVLTPEGLDQVKNRFFQKYYMRPRWMLKHLKELYYEYPIFGQWGFRFSREESSPAVAEKKLGVSGSGEEKKAA